MNGMRIGEGPTNHTLVVQEGRRGSGHPSGSRPTTSQQQNWAQDWGWDMDWGSGLHDDICEKDYILRQLVAEGMMGMQEGMDLDKRLADRWDLCLCARREQSNGGVRAGAQQIWTYTQVIFREAKKMGQEQKPTTAEEWENLREKVIEFKSNVIDARDRFRMRGNR